MTDSTAQRQTLLAVLGLALVLFLASLDQTVVGTAMPRVIAELNGFALYAWVATAYLLSETVVLPIAGKLGDMYGRKWLTIIGVAIFVGASAFCGAAPNMPWLIIGRGIQGLGGGMLFSSVFTLVADIFPDLRDRARYQGMLFSVFALSSVVGPVLGGWITDNLGWRWVFYVNLPLGLLSLATLPRVLPQTPRQTGARIDYRGAVTITVAVVALLLALEWAGAGYGWASARVLGGFALAVVAFALFVPIERRAAEPIIPFSLFRNRTITATSVLLFFFGIGMFGLILYTPLFVQGVLGQSPSRSGAVMIPMVITMTVMGIVVGQVIARVGTMRPFLIGGSAVMCLGVLLLTTLTAGASPVLVAIYLFVTALGMGTVMPVTTLAVQTAVEPRMLGVATAATQFIRSIGSTVGTALIGTLVTSGYTAGLAAHVPQGVPAQAVTALNSPNALVSPEALQRLAQLMARVPNGTQLMQDLLTAARVGLAGAIQRGYLFTLGAMVLALGSCFLIGKLRLSESAAPPVHP